MSYVPVPDPADGWETEVRYVAYGYNTSSADDPTNLLLFGDTMNTSALPRSRRQGGLQPLYTKVLSGVGADANDREVKLRCYATSLESTDRSLADMGKESAAESRAMAAAGKGTAVRTGPRTLQGSSSCAWHVAIPLEKKKPPTRPPMPSCATDALGRPLYADGDCIYRSMSAAAPGVDDDDDGIAEEHRAPPGAKPVKVAAKEGRIGIGTFVEDAKPLPISTPVAKGTPAIATGIYIMTVPMGTCPDDATVVEACRKLKAYYKQACELGTDVAHRLSKEAVKAGLTQEGPVSKKAKAEIAETIGAAKADATMPGTAPLHAATVAIGRPLLSGVPRD